jgi:hypothetical protein
MSNTLEVTTIVTTESQGAVQAPQGESPPPDARRASSSLEQVLTSLGVPAGRPVARLPVASAATPAVPAAAPRKPLFVLGEMDSVVKGPGRRLEGDEVFRDEGMMRRSIARAVGREGLRGDARSAARTPQDIVLTSRWSCLLSCCCRRSCRSYPTCCHRPC